jgi:hypothetical protein
MKKPPKARKKTDLLWTWFIDPWNRTATPLQIAYDLESWYAAIQCDSLDIGVIPANDRGRKFMIDVWCDDMGMYRKPELPTFVIGPHTIYGYGLLFERDGEHTASCGFDADFLIHILGLRFEDWEERLDAKNYFAQLSRVIEWESWSRGPWQENL